jgi:hypothetical protein
MKTTVEISDALLREAKTYAAEHGITLRELMEAGLRGAVAKGTTPRQPFKLKRHPFHGDGMREDYTWDQTLNLIYQGRGGRM